MKLKAGVIGVGYLGRFHAQKYAAMPDVELVGVFDSSFSRAQEVATECGTRAFHDLDALIASIDMASVVTPTIYHHEIATKLLQNNVHCMVEKPVTRTLSEADKLIELAESKNRILQVGHIERFNPAVRNLMDQAKHPLFIEAHRLTAFRARGADVDIVLDLMIHDLDITLALVKSRPSQILASGIPVLTRHVDIANVRIVFENGATANLTASRISLSPMRRIRVFSPGLYISADCEKQENLVVKAPVLVDDNIESLSSALKPEFISLPSKRDILNDEIHAFAKAVRQGGTPVVSGKDGRDALAIALEINQIISTTLRSSWQGSAS